jgi:hypothetical protein
VGSSKDHHNSSLAETLEAEPEDDLEFALIQMKSEMLDARMPAVRVRANTRRRSASPIGVVMISASQRASAPGSPPW